jgi:hypothetical protein
VKRLLASTAVLGLAVAGIGTASAAPDFYKVTGGGQIIAEMASGPGDTIAFNARSANGAAAEEGDDLAVGQLQYNGRTEDPAQKFHGAITCLQVDGNIARLAGYKKGTSGEAGTFFRLLVEDTDNNGPQNGTELLLFNPNADSANCDPVEDEETEDQLGRGNIQIHEPRSTS